MKAAKRFFAMMMAGMMTLQFVAPVVAEEIEADFFAEELVAMDQAADFEEVELDTCDDVLFDTEESFWDDEDGLFEDAEEADVQIDEFAVLELENESFVNPLYAGEVSAPAAEAQDELMMDGEFDEMSALVSADLAADGNYCTTIDEATKQVREHFKNRDTKFNIQYKTAQYSSSIAKEIMARVFDHTGNPVEGDYLKWQYESWNASGRASKSNGYYYCTITYNVSYLTTAAQEQAVDAAFAAALAKMNVYGASDYEKVKAVYDYICSTVNYDYSGDNSNRVRFSAYGAMIDNSCVCQGYALSIYRMLLTLGVDCHLIPGTGCGEAHAWNVVKIGGAYYNLDATWDAGTNGNYFYFLRSDANFFDHVRDAAFDGKYAMATKDYAVTTQSTQNTQNTVVNTPANNDVVVENNENNEIVADNNANNAADQNGSVAIESTQNVNNTVAANKNNAAQSAASTTTQAPAVQHTHSFGAWKVTKEATVASTGSKRATCGCGAVKTAAIAKVAPTAKLNKAKVTLKKGKKVTIKVSGLAKGDSVKSWTTSNKKVAKVNKNGKITAGKKKGTAVITMTTKAGAVRKVTVKVK
ncbi:MAG: transglutaminase domain-containing protein [Lachnospiraceae bacterium]|nr:transglutaminase domain-containing protein [Lachnospiraceae bacterium]